MNDTTSETGGNAGEDKKADAHSDAPIIIKKYANRRLYNTQTSSYVTLDHLCEMVKAGTVFEVRDARTGEDITRSVLTQIIFEEENKGQHMLPIEFLRQLIRFYGDSLQAFLPGYLEMSMASFTKNQGEMRNKFAEAFGRTGFKDFDQLTRNNLQMFERTMRMFSPFGAGQTPSETKPANGPSESAPGSDKQISDLKDQIAAMQRQIADLVGKK